MKIRQKRDFPKKVPKKDRFFGQFSQCLDCRIKKIRLEKKKFGLVHVDVKNTEDFESDLIFSIKLAKSGQK